MITSKVYKCSEGWKFDHLVLKGWSMTFPTPSEAHDARHIVETKRPRLIGKEGFNRKDNAARNALFSFRNNRMRKEFKQTGNIIWPKPTKRQRGLKKRMKRLAEFLEHGFESGKISPVFSDPMFTRDSSKKRLEAKDNLMGVK